MVDIAAQLGHNPTVCLDTYAHVMAEQRDGVPVSAEEQILRARRAAASSVELPVATETPSRPELLPARPRSGQARTGDRAVRHEDGTLRFLGRIDPVMSVAGQLASLTDIEEALLEHPYVRRAIVSERRDGRLGVGVVALVQPDSGVDRHRLAIELGDHINGTLGGLSRPRTILFADEVPRDLSDEELRRAVRAFCSSRQIGATAQLRGPELAEIAGVRR